MFKSLANIFHSSSTFSTTFNHSHSHYFQSSIKHNCISPRLQQQPPHFISLLIYFTDSVQPKMYEDMILRAQRQAVFLCKGQTVNILYCVLRAVQSYLKYPTFSHALKQYRQYINVNICVCISIKLCTKVGHCQIGYSCPNLRHQTLSIMQDKIHKVCNLT